MIERKVVDMFCGMNPKPKLSHADRKLIRATAADYIRNGVPIAKIAERFDKSSAWVYLVAKEFGLNVTETGTGVGRGSNQATTGRTYEIIACLIRHPRKTLESIASEFDVSRQWVSYVLKRVRDAKVPGIEKRSKR